MDDGRTTMNWEERVRGASQYARGVTIGTGGRRKSSSMGYEQYHFSLEYTSLAQRWRVDVPGERWRPNRGG